MHHATPRHATPRHATDTDTRPTHRAPPAVRHRIVEWCERALLEGDRVIERRSLDVLEGRDELPLLVVAGTSDMRVPAQLEADRFVAAVAGATKYLVEGAGHAGALDERIDLREVMDRWRGGRSAAQ